ncbi:MAG: hypothetical protein KGS72_03245 [Cyanobacteria bacterium REEB67]|nr:hypothetical protein [Cyanobacteria bacterium REEB67]
MSVGFDSIINQKPIDTTSDKIGRESSTLAAGIAQGFYAAGTNVSEHPYQTAVEVATGVAVSVLVNRVAILKLPALAIAAVGAAETVGHVSDFAHEALPAVSEIWSNPEVSKETVTGLTHNVRDVTAATTIGVGSLLLANKGFSLLEKSAPNNAVGRYVFGHEPVSFLNPRHKVTPWAGTKVSIEVLPFKPREVDKLVSVETRDHTYPAYSAGPFKSISEANAIGRRFFVEPSRVYTIKGAKTEVIVPLSLDRQFDRVRDMEKALTFPRSIFNGGRNQTLRRELASDPLSTYAKPEEILASLSTVPDAKLLDKIVLSPYELDRFRIHRFKKGTDIPVSRVSHPSGMAVERDETTYLKHDAQSRPGVDRNAGDILRHEWSHFAEFKDDEYKLAFRRAAGLERFGYYDRKYATTNDAENQAVHLGEGLLSSRYGAFLRTAEEAPIRSAVMGRRLRDVLDAVPAEERGLFHKYYSERVERIEKQITPKALRRLNFVKNGSDNGEVPLDAFQLIAYLRREKTGLEPFKL